MNSIMHMQEQDISMPNFQRIVHSFALAVYSIGRPYFAANTETKMKKRMNKSIATHQATSARHVVTHRELIVVVVVDRRVHWIM